MKNIGFSGTFDPITKGHLWVIEEGLNIADNVIVFVAVNSSKSPMFSMTERVKLIQDSTAHLGERVKVVSVEGAYVAQVAKEDYDCEYMIRGIRNAGDFDYESLIQQTNRDVLAGAKTIFVFPPRDLDSVSSSFVKSLAGPTGWHYYVSEFLPVPVINFWILKNLNKIIENVFQNCINEGVSEGLVKENKKITTNLLNKMTLHKNAYHNIGHILYCWQSFQEQQKLNPDLNISNPSYKNGNFQAELLISLLGHDVIMEGSDGLSPEELSANYVKSLFQETGKEVRSVEKAILSTAYLGGKVNPVFLEDELAQVLTSIDLAILSSPEPIYKKYSQDVRKEYSHISNEDYVQGRRQALGKLLNLAEEGKLYLHSAWQEKNKLAAKRIIREIKELNN